MRPVAVTPEARWLHDLDVRRAGRCVAVPGGCALLHDDFPAAHDHNKLSLLSGDDAAQAAALAEEHLAGRGHLRVEPRHTGAERLAAGLEAAGYQREDLLVMTWAAEPARRRPDVRVVELGLAQRVAAAAASWRDELPDAGERVWQQLGERITTALPAATTSLLGVLDDSGRVVARADVLVHGQVGQVEEVMTDVAHRGRGLATALVLDGAAWARARGATTVLLVADADDWPRRLYESLGFRDRQVLPVLSAPAGPAREPSR